MGLGVVSMPATTDNRRVGAMQRLFSTFVILAVLVGTVLLGGVSSVDATVDTAVDTAVELAPTRTANQPVVFVHGYTGSGANWNSAVANFRSSGYDANELFVFEYNWRQSNATTGVQLAGYIDEVRAATGWLTVDVVAHSMGSLSSRYCIKLKGCGGKVDSWVSLGGPNHGSWLALGCALLHTSCAEMVPTSSFLAQLNAGDETPATAASYTTIRTPCDLVVWPSSSTELSGANNLRTSCFVSHPGLTSNGRVLTWVKNAL